MWKSEQASLAFLMKWRTSTSWSAPILLSNFVFFGMTDECPFLTNVCKQQQRHYVAYAVTALHNASKEIQITVRQRPHAYPHFIMPYSCSVRVLSEARQILLLLLSIHGCFAVNSWLNSRRKYCRILIVFLCRNFQWFVSLVTKTRSL
jgi:hypothetical protein